MPLNTLFGIVVRARDRPQAVPGEGGRERVHRPAAGGVAGRRRASSLFLLYGRGGWLYGFFERHGVQILFSLPAMVIATMFVSLPFVAREVVPTLREIGDEQEQAAHTLGASGWQTFWRITLPSIRWAVIYGVVLTTARCLGEYGAVAVVRTATRPDGDAPGPGRLRELQPAGRVRVSLVLAVIAVIVLVSMILLQPREEHA